MVVLWVFNHGIQLYCSLWLYCVVAATIYNTLKNSYRFDYTKLKKATKCQHMYNIPHKCLHSIFKISGNSRISTDSSESQESLTKPSIRFKKKRNIKT